MKKTIISTLLLITIAITLFANLSYADSYDKWKKLTPQEQRLYSTNPMKAIKAKKAADLAFTSTAKRWKTYTHWQGNGDAYRHAFWNAIMTKKISRSFAYDVGLAHEGLYKGYSWKNLSSDTKMDVSNNYYGRKLGSYYKKKKYSDTTIAKKVTWHVKNKKLKRIRVYTRKKSNRYPYKIWNGVGTKYVGYYYNTNSGGSK